MSSGTFGHEQSHSLSVFTDRFGVDHSVGVKGYFDLATRRDLLKVSNPPNSNIPFFLKRAGVVDKGRFEERSPRNVSQGSQGPYRIFRNYDILALDVRRSINTQNLMGHMNTYQARRQDHATTYELLVVFEAAQQLIRSILTLKKKARLVALNGDIFHPNGAAFLVMNGGQVELHDIDLFGQEMWHPPDLFLVRSQGPS